MITVILVLVAAAIVLLLIRRPLNHAIARTLARHYGRNSVPRHLVDGDLDDVLDEEDGGAA